MRRTPSTDLETVFAARGWLSEHPSAFRALMVGEGIPVTAQAGTYVYHRDDESNGLYGVISGAVGVEGGHRRQTPLMGHVMRSGEWFGIRAVVQGGPRELSYRALEPTRLLFVSRSRLAPLMQTNPEIAVRVAQLGDIGSRLGSWIARDLLTPDAGRRLAAVLFRVTGAGGVPPDDAEGYRLTHQQLGEMANLSRHHVGRKLAAFQAAGWIDGGYNRIRILNPDALSAFAYGDEGG